MKNLFIYDPATVIQGKYGFLRRIPFINLWARRKQASEMASRITALIPGENDRTEWVNRARNLLNLLFESPTKKTYQNIAYHSHFNNHPDQEYESVHFEITRIHEGESRIFLLKRNGKDIFFWTSETDYESILLFNMNDGGYPQHYLELEKLFTLCSEEHPTVSKTFFVPKGFMQTPKKPENMPDNVKSIIDAWKLMQKNQANTPKRKERSAL